MNSFTEMGGISMAKWLLRCGLVLAALSPLLVGLPAALILWLLMPMAVECFITKALIIGMVRIDVITSISAAMRQRTL